MESGKVEIVKKLEKGTNVVEDNKKINKHNQSIICEEN